MIYTPSSCASAAIRSARRDQRIQSSPTSTRKCLAAVLRHVAAHPAIDRLPAPQPPPLPPDRLGDLFRRRLGRLQQGCLTTNVERFLVGGADEGVSAWETGVLSAPGAKG